MAGVEVHSASPINPQPSTQTTRRTSSIAAARYVPASPTKPAGPPPIQTARPSAPAVSEPGSSQRNESIAGISPTTTQAAPIATSEPPPPQAGAAPKPEDVKEVEETTKPAPEPVIKPASEPATKPAPYPKPPVAFHKPMSSVNNFTQEQPTAFSTSIQFTNPFSSARDLSHPPGYVQNSQASFEDRPFMSPDENSNIGAYLRRSVGGGILNGEMDTSTKRESEDMGVWDRAMSWAMFAGKKLSQGEELFWKVASGDK